MDRVETSPMLFNQAQVSEGMSILMKMKGGPTILEVSQLILPLSTLLPQPTFLVHCNIGWLNWKNALIEVCIFLQPLRKLMVHLENVREELFLLVRTSYWLQIVYSEISGK